MTFLLFIAILAVLILAHELGHFVLAKLSGAKVEEFGLGFPPRLFAFKKGETLYSVNLIPFGGFVKLFGEDSDEKLPRSFFSRPLYWRAAILFAGVFFNFLLAWFLLAGVFTAGAPTEVGAGQSGRVIVLETLEGSAAERIGFLPGDQLKVFSSEGQTLEVKNIEDVQNFTSRFRGREIKIAYSRGKEDFSADVTLPAETSGGAPLLGIAMAKVADVSLPLHKAFYESFKTVCYLVWNIIVGLAKIVGGIFSGGGAAGQVMGPVGIAGLVGQALGFGWFYVLQLVIILSLHLAILNLLPIPALDGGRLLFLAIEAVKRSPISQRAARAINNLGFAFLIILMIFITFRDIIHLFRS